MNILRKGNETKKAYILRCVGIAGITAAIITAIISAYWYILRQFAILHDLVLIQTTAISNQIAYELHRFMKE